MSGPEGEAERLARQMRVVVIGRVVIAAIASWLAVIGIPGSVLSASATDSQKALVAGLGLLTIAAVAVVVIPWSLRGRVTEDQASIGLLLSRFGLILAAADVVVVGLIPEGRDVVLGATLILVLLAAFYVTMFGVSSQRVRITPSRGPTPVASRTMADGVTSQTFILVSTLIIGGGAGGFAALKMIDPTTYKAYPLPIILIAGFVSVTLLLLIATAVLRILGLGTRKEALGMPAGSIRALIAMSLILLFAIVGIAVFQVGAGIDSLQSKGIDKDALERLDQTKIIAIQQFTPAPAAPGASLGPVTYDVTSQPDLPPSGHDFGLQLLTTVSTLVVAVSGFYFGSKSVAAARAAVGPGTVVDSGGSISVVSPTSPFTLVKAGAKFSPVDIKIAVTPSFLRVDAEVIGNGTVAASSADTFTFTPDDQPTDRVNVVFTLPAPYVGSATLSLKKPA